MFDFLKKESKKKTATRKENSELSAPASPGTENTVGMAVEGSADTSGKNVEKTKLSFHEEQYLRIQKIMEEKEKAAFEEFKKGPNTTRYDVQEKSRKSFIYGLASVGQLASLLLNACWRNPFIKYFSFAAGGFFVAALIIYLWSLIRY